MNKIEKIFHIILIAFNTCVFWTMAFVGIFVVAFRVSSHIFDQEELKELQDTYSSTPLMDIIESNKTNDLSLVPLLGKYQGLKGGHKYQKCNYLFPKTCEDYKSWENIYCSSDDHIPLDKSTCVDYPTIPETNYTNYKNKYLYAKKNNDMTYEALYRDAISKNKKCPEGYKKCGILNNDLMTCFKNEDDCPINDLVINNNSEYIKDNILYKTLEINKNEYFHYTNEQINNQIIFDLIISLEHPLSKIELSEENYDTIYKCHEMEKQSYYKGDITSIKSYKQIYNTSMTYKELLEYNGLYDIIMTEPKYRSQHFPSKVFIYKKYPVPITTLTIDEINDLESDYFSSFVLNFVSCGFLFLAYVFYMLFMSIESCRICLYSSMSVVHFLICLFFLINIKTLTNSEVFHYEDMAFTDKDNSRIQLLSFHATYTALVLFQNLCCIFAWVRHCIIETKESRR